MKLTSLLLGLGLVIAVGCGAPAESGVEPTPDAPKVEGKPGSGMGTAPMANPEGKKSKKMTMDATAIMMDAKLAPNEKYPKALKMFREAVKIDPANTEAAENIKMIEDIYKGMGKEVPK